MKKRVLAAILAMSMALGMLAGCGGKNSDQEEADNKKNEEQKDKEDDKKDEESKEKGDTAELRLVLYGDAGTRNVEFFENEFHDKIMEDLNIDLTVEFQPWGQDALIATRLASGERFAFMCMVSDSMEWVKKGFLASFDEDMINEVAPDYVDARMGNGYEFTSYKGEIVSIPMGASIYGGAQDNFTIRNDILNQAGWDYTEIKTYEDLMDALAAVHAMFPDLCLIGQLNFLPKALSSVYAPDALLKPDQLTGLVTYDESDPDSDEVISWLESEYFEKLCKMLEEWYALGYTDMDHISDSVHVDDWNAQNALMYFGSPSRIYSHDDSSNPDVDYRYLSINGDQQKVVLRNYDWGFSASVADQDNTENWMRLFNWLYASKENYGFAVNGVEGVDYQINEDGTTEKLTSDSFFYSWQCGTLKYADFSEYDEAEVEEYLHFDDNAIPTKSAGFVFENTSVKTEEALLQTIISEKVEKIARGLGNYDEEFPAILQELKDAGLDKYIEEYQRQFSEFMATK